MGPCPGPYGGPRGVSISYPRGTPVLTSNTAVQYPPQPRLSLSTAQREVTRLFSSKSQVPPAPKVVARLEKGIQNSHGARPVHLIVTMIKWIRTSRLSMKNSRCHPTGPTTGVPHL